ncbi:hypothetical protein MUNTM_35370 [Mycobacterium sp. MUNTM1]
MVGELADRSDSARLALERSFAEWQSYLSKGFAVMRDGGDLVPEADVDELALTMMTALQGGLLMAQTTRSVRPLELALNMALGHVARYRRDAKPSGHRSAGAPREYGSASTSAQPQLSSPSAALGIVEASRLANARRHTPVVQPEEEM